MDLRSYLHELPLGGRAEFAQRVGVAPAFLYQMASGYRPVPLRYAAAIVRESRGVVSLHDLYPDLSAALPRRRMARA